MTTKDALLWLCLACLWGTSFLAIGVAVETVSPVDVVTGRMAIGSALLLAIAIYRRGSLAMSRRAWVLAAVVGISGNVLPFLLIGFAEQRVDSGLAALIMGIAPVVTLVCAPFIHPDEPLTRTKLAGAAVGFAGIVILVGPGALGGMEAETLAQIALLAAALSYSFTALFSRRYPYDDPLQMAAASVLVGTLLIGSASWLNWQPGAGENMTGLSIFAVGYLGVGPTALAAAIYFYLIPRIGAGRLQQVNYVVPVLGTLLGIFLLGERPQINTWIAIPFVLSAVYIVTRKS